MGSSFYQDTGIDKDQVKTASQVAQEALERIAALYAVEKAIRGRPPDERHQVRQECSRPVAEDLFAWMESTLPKLSGRSDLAAAMRYALARRENLLRYLDDGRSEEHTSELQSLMRISYAVFCLKKKKTT